MVPVTGFFAAVLALFFITLSVYVIRRRYTHRLALGDGGDADMNRRIRAHANFAEYVPLALILMGVNELNGVSPFFLKAMGTVLLMGRISHAYSLTRHETKHGKILFRQLGMGCSFTVIICLALAALL